MMRPLSDFPGCSTQCFETVSLLAGKVKDL